MLTIHKITVGAVGGYVEYLTSAEKAGKGDYYLSAEGLPGANPAAWLGAIAAALGLGEVTRKDLNMLMQGRHPCTGELLVRLGASGDHTAAHDCTFSAPSSVTAAWALADPELRVAIQRAHDEAVREAFTHIERTFPLVRRRHPLTRKIVTETAAALLSLPVPHHTARRTETQVALGAPPDPQLHTHLLLLMAQRQDGRLVALNSLTLFRGRREAGAVYRASLAARLAQLGFTIQRRTGSTRQYFEIAGVPEALREAWSSRHHEVLAKGEEWRERFRATFGRAPTLFEERAWAAKTRARKAPHPYGDLLRHWRTQAGFLGVTAATIAQLREDSSTLPPVEAGRFRLIAELLSAEGVTEEHAQFDLSRLRLAAYLHAQGLLASEHVEETVRRLLRHEDVTELAEGVWSTREMLATEQRVLGWREARSTHGRPAGGERSDRAAWERALARCPVQLSTEQRAAVEALRDGARFMAIAGEAGVGKGVVLRVAAEAWRAEGRQVLAVAISGAQAQRLAADLGKGTPALTLDAFIHRMRRGRLSLGPHDVIALDEAGQVDTRRWGRLAAVLAGAGSPALVAMGDEAQLSPIGAGGLWSHLAAGAVRLTEVRRTQGWERDAWKHVRQGESQEALQLYAQHSRLDLSATRAEAIERAVAAWDADGRRGLIVTDASNAERYEANRAAQRHRRERGELGGASTEVLTPSGTVQLHAHDRVILRGLYRLGEGERIENGTTGEVVDVGAAGAIRIRTHESTPRELAVPGRWEDGWLDLHYAAHVAAAQGTTVPTTYAICGGWATHRESLYVQLSRAREGARIFVDRESLEHDVDADALGELVRRSAESRAKVPAISRRLPRRSSCRQARPAWFTQAVVAQQIQTQEAIVHGPS